MDPRHQTGKALIVWLVIALLLAGGIIAMQLQQPPPPPQLQQSTWLPTPQPLTEFSLIDHNGAPFDLARFKGQWSLVFFGYTHCPDICPTTMNDLNSMIRVLNADYPQVTSPVVIFVSVDPERDTPERLHSYAPYFNEAFLGVSGESQAVTDFSKQLHAYFRYVKNSPDSQDYIVDHSAGINLIDPAGRLHALFTPPLKPREIAHDYAAIIEYYEANH